MPGKRSEYLSWQQYFMGNALLASMRSKDPSNQVGACIVDESTHKVLSVGYNGLTLGMDDDTFDWLSTGEKTGDVMHVKDHYIVHAERNAILNYAGNTKDLEGTTMYVTWFPCAECTKEVIQAGIKKIVYLRMYSKKEAVQISMFMLRKAGVVVEEYNSEVDFTKEEVQESTMKIQSEIMSLSKKRK